MWNGNQHYVSQNPTRLDFSNQIPQQQQQQRLPPRQSTQYSQAINNTVPTNNCKIEIINLDIHYLFLISTTK
jgi:hypothetical protein